MYPESEIEHQRYVPAQSLASALVVEVCKSTIEDLQYFDRVVCGTMLYEQFLELSLPESDKLEFQVEANLINFVKFV
jgi:hypothetical protein